MLHLRGEYREASCGCKNSLPGLAIAFPENDWHNTINLGSGENAMIASAIPVTIDDSAKQRIEELSLSSEFERMLEHASETIPGLVRIEVSSPEPYEQGEERQVYLDAVVKTTDVNELLGIDRAWNKWRYTILPPELAMHFLLMSIPESNYAA